CSCAARPRAGGAPARPAAPGAWNCWPSWVRCSWKRLPPPMLRTQARLRCPNDFRPAGFLQLLLRGNDRLLSSFFLCLLCLFAAILLPEVVMAVRRMALVFDDRARPETTGVYCRRALGGLLEVEHFLPGDLGRVPRRGVDLYLNIDDGLDYRWPAELRPCAWWAIDTHLAFDWCRTKPADFDWAFAAPRGGAEQLRLAVTAPAVWLPLACDPEIHRRHEVAKEYDLCFVGNVFPGPRTDLLDLLQRQFPRMFVGRCYFEKMARTYSAAQVVFN